MLFWILLGACVIMSVGGYLTTDERKKLKELRETCSHDWDLRWHGCIYEHPFSYRKTGHEYHYRCTKCRKTKHKIVDES